MVWKLQTCKHLCQFHATFTFWNGTATLRHLEPNVVWHASVAKCEALSFLAAKAGHSKGEESVGTADQEVDIPPASSSIQGPDKNKLLMLSLLLLILLLLFFSFSSVVVVVAGWNLITVIPFQDWFGSCTKWFGLGSMIAMVSDHDTCSKQWSVCLLESPLFEDVHRFCKLVELDLISNIEPFLPYPGPMNNGANGSMAGAGYGTQGQSRVCRYFVAQELYFPILHRFPSYLLVATFDKGFSCLTIFNSPNHFPSKCGFCCRLRVVCFCCEPG